MIFMCINYYFSFVCIYIFLFIDQSKMSEEISEKPGTSNEKSLAISTAGKGVTIGTNCTDGQSLKATCVVGASGTPILRQNSSSSVNSCLGTSPNTSEHSNNSNLSASAALNQIVDSDIVQKEDQSKKMNSGNEEKMGKVYNVYKLLFFFLCLTDLTP